MRYHILATDYDGTIAHHGGVTESTIEALKKFKTSGRKLILVTGRELDELMLIFPQYEIFDLIVAENGALIHTRGTQEEFLLGERPPDSFIEELKKQYVSPLSIGKVIVATWEPHHTDVLEAIKKTGIEYQVIFNKGAVMVLPPGINKAKGLQVALERMGYSMHNVVAVGDAENDNAMLSAAECGVAVSNALDAVKEQASFVTTADHGDGVAELIEKIVDNDLSDIDHLLQKHFLILGKEANEQNFALSPYTQGVIVAGTSGGGKSTLTVSFLESLNEQKYQYCLIDPEGDYIDFDTTVVIGDAEHEPALNEIIKLLENPTQNVVVCTLAISLDKRPGFFNTFIAGFTELKIKMGHPHWLIVDEANHLMPVETEHTFFNLPSNLNNIWLVATEPVTLNSSIMQFVNTVIAIGDKPDEVLQQYAEKKNIPYHPGAINALPKGKAWVWQPEHRNAPFTIVAKEPVHVAKRHKRKYVTGVMEYSSFFFKGPANKLNLKAYNVNIFSQLASGVDDETWLYHLKQHDYSEWFKDALHENNLAKDIYEIEATIDDAESSKQKILKLIKENYAV